MEAHEAEGPPSTSIDGKAASMSRRYLINLAGVLALGVLASFWVLYFTDAFEIVGGLLALGGLFSWIAVVGKVLPEERFKELQQWVDRRVLGSPKTSWRLIGIGVALALAAACFGTVELETRGRAGDYLVHVHRPGATTSADDFVAVTAGQSKRAVRFAFGRSWVVHVKGFPDHQLRLWPFHRETVVVPDSLMRPVVLLRPSIEMTEDSMGKDAAKTMVVTIFGGDNKPVANYTMVFDGHAVWVGCDDDVEVPARFFPNWKEELLESMRPERQYLALWGRPRSLAREAKSAMDGDLALVADLQRDMRLRVTIYRDAAKTEKWWESAVFPVVPGDRWDDFPQVFEMTKKSP